MAPMGRGGGGEEGDGGPKHSTHPVARLVSSSSAALIELLVFHPIDTAAKRIITHHGRLLTSNGLTLGGKIGLMHEVVFREKTRANPMAKFISLFPGIRHAVCYKVCQRTTTFGLQPFLFDHLHQQHHEAFVAAVGKKRARNLEYSTAAAVVGMGEIVFLPFDTLKILYQTNPGSVQGRSLLEVAQQEGIRKLYRGAAWTTVRNAPGSFALFGGNALVKEQVFKLERYSDATLMQDIVASTTGAVWSLTLSSPADVIKARVQRASLSGNRSEVRGREILRALLQKEGPLALFKGLTTKCMIVGPKLVMSFTIYSQLLAKLDRSLRGEEQQSPQPPQQQQQKAQQQPRAAGASGSKS